MDYQLLWRKPFDSRGSVTDALTFPSLLRELREKPNKKQPKEPLFRARVYVFVRV